MLTDKIQLVANVPSLTTSNFRTTVVGEVGQPVKAGPPPGGASTALEQLGKLGPQVRRAGEELLEHHPSSAILQQQLGDLANRLLARAAEPTAAVAAVRTLGEVYDEVARATPDLASQPAPVVARPLSHRAERALRRACGRDGAAFFDLAETVLRAESSKHAPRGLPVQLRAAARQLANVGGEGGAPLPLPTKNHLLAQVEKLAALAERASADPGAWEELRSTLRGLLVDVAKARGVYLTPDIARGGLRLMRERESKLERLREADPERHALLVARRVTYRRAEKEVQARAAEAGIQVHKAWVMWREVFVGPAADGTPMVFDIRPGARGVPLSEFIEARRADLALRERATEEPPVEAIPQGVLSRLDDATVDALTTPLAYVALTDDTAAECRLTRMMATREHEGRRIIVDGPWKGVAVDDLTHQLIRQAEGVTYRVQVPGLPGTRVKTALPPEEPLISMTRVKVGDVWQERLMLSLPSGREWTETRRAVRDLTKLVPSMRYQPGSNNTTFTFEPKDYGLVAGAVHGLALSSAAHDVVGAHYEAIARAQKATEVDLEAYSFKAIGGFREKVRGPDGCERPVELHRVQKRALAWLEANGDRGLLALDCGLGKTVTAVAMMQKLLRDGATKRAGSNGRFLFVCPGHLRGNVIAEIHRFLEPEAAKALLARLDIMTYGQFANAVHSGERKGQPWDAEAYASIFVDEAQNLRNPASRVARAALTVKNPHKVLMTASPVEKSPVDAFVLAAAAGAVELMVDGVPTRLSDFSDKKQRRAYFAGLRKLRDLYIQTVGGRIVGTKEDPAIRSDLGNWVRRHIFFADVSAVTEFNLERPRSVSLLLEMSPELRAEYEATAGKLLKTFEGMVALYRDKGVDVAATAEAGRPVRSALARDRRISDVFGPKCRELISHLNDLANRGQGTSASDPAGASHTKVTLAADYLNQRLAAAPGSRAVLFTDDARLALDAARELSLRVPGVHAVGLAGSIHLFECGRELGPEDRDRFGGHVPPFEPKPYRRFPAQRPDPRTNRHYPKAQWQQFVLQELLSTSSCVKSMTLAGQCYQQGVNLQTFDTVVHLDRDSWNAEDMRQRTARVWRQGQERPVDEVFIDMVYSASNRDTELNLSLDSLRALHQEVQAQLFDDVIRQPQQAELGGEWFSAERLTTSGARTSAELMEMVMVPTVQSLAGAA